MVTRPVECVLQRPFFTEISQVSVGLGLRLPDSEIFLRVEEIEEVLLSLVVVNKKTESIFDIILDMAFCLPLSDSSAHILPFFYNVSAVLDMTKTLTIIEYGKY